MSYTLEPRRGEILLRFTPDAPLIDLQRGSALAKSLNARFARGYIGYHMSAPNARKFGALFEAGFSAYRCMRNKDWVWRYGRDDGECKRLPDAVNVARQTAGKEGICQH